MKWKLQLGKVIVNSNGNVFINCPFDSEYSALFDAILFTVFCCSFRPRCAYEAGDEDRLNRICSIVEECEFGIHDLSRTELNAQNLPRFNMPLELGIFIGAKRYGGTQQKKKHYLILDTERYRYQQFISDLGGQDPKAHSNDPAEAIKKVRSWLKSHSDNLMPGATAIQGHYRHYLSQLPDLLRKSNLTEEDAEYSDTTSIMEGWVDFHLC